MDMTPTAKEVAWLFGSESVNKLDMPKGNLHLSGNGYTNNYNLNGLWDLTSATYDHPDIIHKPAGKANHLSFKINMNREETTLSEVHYDLTPLSLAASVNTVMQTNAGFPWPFVQTPFKWGHRPHAAKDQ